MEELHLSAVLTQGHARRGLVADELSAFVRLFSKVEPDQTVTAGENKFKQKIKNKLCTVCNVFKTKEEWQRFLYRLSVCVCVGWREY